MGNDYIQRSNETFRKGRDRARRKLSLVDLFRISSEKVRLLSVQPIDLSRFRKGDQYELQVEGGSISVFLDWQLIGKCDEPPGSILKELIDIGGKALGVLDEVREHSGVVDIAVCLASEAVELVA